MVVTLPYPQRLVELIRFFGWGYRVQVLNKQRIAGEWLPHVIRLIPLNELEA
jgi:hypothetical protein